MRWDLEREGSTVGEIRVPGGVSVMAEGGMGKELQEGAESDPGDGSSRCGHRSEPQEDTAGDRLTEAQVPWLPQ